MKATFNSFGKIYEVELTKKQYSNGATAVLATMTDGEPFAVLSVNIVDTSLPSKVLHKNQCWFKTWSENEGLLEQLIEQKIVKSLGVYHQETGAVVVEILF